MSFRIKRLWAWISADNKHDAEGLVAHFDVERGIWIPLVGADEDRLSQLRDIAQKSADVSGHPVQLVRFDVRTDVETLSPKRRPS